MSEQFWHKNVSNEDIEEAKSAYKDAFQYAILVSAKVDESNDLIESKWSHTDVSDLTGKKFYVCTSTIQEPFITSRPVFYKETELWTSANTYTARLVSKSSNYYVEVWSNWFGSSGTSVLEKSINLSERNLHGTIYFDNNFKGFSLDPTGNKLAFIAEKKRAKSSGFFQNTGSSSNVLPGQEYNYVDDWGEQMNDKSTSVVVILDWISEDLQVLELPYDQYCFGNVIWINSTEVVGTAFIIEAYRMGIIYTTSKPTKIFRVNTTNVSSTFEFISDSIEGLCCRSPRLSPDSNTLIWLERELNDRIHACVLKLKGLDLRIKNAKPRLIIQTKNDFMPEIDEFAGLNRPLLAERCFINNDEIIFSDVVIDKPTMFRCNINNLNDVTPYKDDQCVVVQDVSSEKNAVLFLKSSPLNTPSLWMGVLNENQELSAKCVIDGFDLKENNEFNVETLIHTPKLEHDNPLYKNVKYSSVYTGANTTSKLICWPHGGPHSVMTREFSNDIMFWLKMGYGILRINYRGSLGFGQASVDSLTNHSGTNDVQDCQEAVEDCLAQFQNLNKENLLLYGGSHGGYLVLHLSGQYPDTYKACVARNPVTNVATKVMVADNPDSGFNQAALDFDFTSPNPEAMAKLFNNSPMKYVKNVKIPIHLNLGTQDRRVMKTQGMEYFRNMKALGKNVSVNIYEDNHPLSKVSTHTNILINAALFFKSILSQQ